MGLFVSDTVAKQIPPLFLVFGPLLYKHKFFRGMDIRQQTRNDIRAMYRRVPLYPSSPGLLLLVTQILWVGRRIQTIVTRNRVRSPIGEFLGFFP